MLINDVGGAFEEINVGQAGDNYGWPAVEHGPPADDRSAGPLYWYPRSSIAGGDFVPATSAWPVASARSCKYGLLESLPRTLELIRIDRDGFCRGGFHGGRRCGS